VFSRPKRFAPKKRPIQSMLKRGSSVAVSVQFSKCREDRPAFADNLGDFVDPYFARVVSLERTTSMYRSRTRQYDRIEIRR